MAVADVAAWFAIKTRFGAEDKSVTISQNTQFISSVRNDDFVCEAEIHKAGERLVFLIAVCKSEAGKLLTSHTITYLRMS